MSASVAIQAKPLARTTSSGHSLINRANRSGWNGRLRRYTNEPMPYSSVSGVWLSCCSSWIQPADWLACSKSNNPVFRISCGSTRPMVERISLAVGCSLRKTPSSSISSFSSTRSHLFRIRMSHVSIWSINRSTTSRVSPSPACCPRSRSVSPEEKSCQNR
ncbi:hypothetical protein D3C74_302630 [compost metagenome]